MYDQLGPQGNEQQAVILDSGLAVCPTDQVYIMLGRKTSTAGGQYKFRIKSNYKGEDGLQKYDVIKDSGIERTVGWHKFTFDYSDPSKVTIMIDDMSNKALSVSVQEGIMSGFSKITIGNYWGLTGLEALYVDSISVKSRNNFV